MCPNNQHLLWSHTAAVAPDMSLQGTGTLPTGMLLLLQPPTRPEYQAGEGTEPPRASPATFGLVLMSPGLSILAESHDPD